MRLARFGRPPGLLLLAGLAAVSGRPAAAQVTLPESSCLAAKILCVSKYVSALARCDAKAAKRGGDVDVACTARAGEKLANAQLKGCLDKAARRTDCVVDGPQADVLQAASDDFVSETLCLLDPMNDACGPPWYLDADGDGHGNPNERVLAQAPPSGYVASSDDCNDADSHVYGGAQEVCDGLDNDCEPATVESCGGCIPVETTGSRYLFCGGVGANWASARNACLTNAFDLAHIEDASENAFVRNAATSAGVGQVFLAGTDADTEGTWRWADDSIQFHPIVAGVYANWEAGEPDDDGGNEDCLTLASTGVWNDTHCTALLLPYVCERAEP